MGESYFQYIDNMRTKINLTGDPKRDLEILLEKCSNNNQRCYHIKKNQYIIDYLISETGLINEPIVVLYYHFKEALKEIPKCTCGKNRKYHCDGYRPTCSDLKCQNITRENSKKKFCLENYGVEFVTQLDSMKEKSKSTLISKYGVDNITKLPETIRRRKDNNLKKWGVEDPIVLEEFRKSSERGLETIQNGLYDGYKVLESDKRYYYKLSCPNGHIFEVGKSVIYLRKKSNISLCNECNTSKCSNGEQELYDYISSIYTGSISRSNRKLIKPFEIDIILEDIKLCIEFNGDYWHSTKIVNDKFYHLNKLKMCLEMGYGLIQIRENDWNRKKETIKGKLFNIIHDIYDRNDLDIEDGFLKFDLSWYDTRISRDFSDLLVEQIEPNLLKVGQYDQWDCGYRIYQIK